jgi:hypothetical protein
LMVIFVNLDENVEEVVKFDDFGSTWYITSPV